VSPCQFMHVHKRFETRANPHFQKIQFFLLKINIFFFMFWIVLMRWTQLWFLKNKKNIILMHFGMKNTLKSNRNHTPKQSCTCSNIMSATLYSDFCSFTFCVSNLCFSTIKLHLSMIYKEKGHILSCMVL